MENATQDINEQLLDSWIQISRAIRNDKICSKFSYNESSVLNLLAADARKGGEGLTATQLCDATQIQKSQMNRILTGLEEKAYIIRMRSSVDRRKVLVRLGDLEPESFDIQHSYLIDLAREVVNDLGEQRVREISAALQDLAAEARVVLARMQ